jgi:hypothetical protein
MMEHPSVAIALLGSGSDPPTNGRFVLISRIVDAAAGKRYLFVAMCLTVASCKPPLAQQSAAPDEKQLEASVPGDRESAQKAIGEIEAELSAVSIDSEKYQPKHLGEVQREVSMLRAQLAQGAYQSVLDSAPLVKNLVDILARGTALRKDQATATGDRGASELTPLSSFRVFAVLDHRGMHYELSDEPVPTCVHVEGEDRSDWKLASISGRGMGTVKSCWYKSHVEEMRLDIGADLDAPNGKHHFVTVPAHDEIVVCLPYAREKGASKTTGPACQNIDPEYFTAVDSLPRPAF